MRELVLEKIIMTEYVILTYYFVNGVSTQTP